jgi:hypothetical protein
VAVRGSDVFLRWGIVSLHCSSQDGVACPVVSRVGDFSSFAIIAQRRVRPYNMLCSGNTIKLLFRGNERLCTESDNEQRTEASRDR